MATIVERPRGALNDPHDDHSQQSRLNPIEIIDVDSFDEEASASSSSQFSRPPPRPRGRQESRQRETISLLDSDDEVEIVSSRILSGHDVDRNRSHRHFISPPPRDLSAPPPVPPVPRRYAGQTSFPMRRQPEYPPVMPLTEPLPFESAYQPPVAGPSNQVQRILPERAAPPSHHIPTMGLGGALISQNRAQAIQRQREADIAATTVRRARPFRRHHYNPFTITERDDDTYIHMLLNPYIDDDFTAMTYRYHQHRNRAAEAAEKEQYQPSYTHPDRPEPGFTFDFALPEDESVPRDRLFPPTSKDQPIILDDDAEGTTKPSAGPSSSSSSAREPSPGSKLNLLLVCAKCLDPLILNAAMDPEEAQYRRVWALRCGHLIDEKCLNNLGQPPEEEVVPDKKGKGKAKTPAHHHTYGDAVPEVQAQAHILSAMGGGTRDIRSRLRSRRAAANASDPTMPGAYPSSPSAPSTLQQRPSPAKKRKVSAKKPKIEAEYEWACPVAGCGRVHVSVRIDGIWGPEKELPVKGAAGKAADVRAEPRGVIAVFA